MTKRLRDNLEHLLKIYFDDEIEYLEELISEEDDDFEELPIDLNDAINEIIYKYPKYTNSLGFSWLIIKQELRNEKNTNKML